MVPFARTFPVLLGSLSRPSHCFHHHNRHYLQLRMLVLLLAFALEFSHALVVSNAITGDWEDFLKCSASSPSDLRHLKKKTFRQKIKTRENTRFKGLKSSFSLILFWKPNEHAVVVVRFLSNTFATGNFMIIRKVKRIEIQCVIVANFRTKLVENCSVYKTFNYN